MREYAVQGDSQVIAAEDVSAHVSTLLINNTTQLISEENLGFVFLLNSEEVTGDNQILVYNYHWQGDAKAQSAWQKWTLWAKPIGGICFDGYLYLICTEKRNDTRSDNVFIKINLRGKEVPLVDTDGRDYKVTRPNIDRMSVLPDDDPIRIGDNVYLSVANGGALYDFTLEGQVPIMVDRITGETFRYKAFHTFGDEFTFTSDPAVLLGDDVNALPGVAPLGGS